MINMLHKPSRHAGRLSYLIVCHLVLAKCLQDKDAVTETTVGSVEVKSRDFVLGTSTTTKRKSKKRSEAVPSETIPAHASTTDTAHHSGAMAFKFVLGVALVSMVIGVILGKRY